MHLIQILLPVRDNDGKPFGPHPFEDVYWTLSKKFGGVTGYTRAPAEGRWEASGKTQHDDVLVIEVMVETLDKTWWSDFRQQLEATFRQSKVIVRAQPIELL
ncbi:MAG TPA: hypothetical protein PLD46_09635 [Hyphomicrobium sp.]|nr:hypothetical protein [Hyphomicrobium sp.]